MLRKPGNTCGAIGAAFAGAASLPGGKTQESATAPFGASLAT
jgi:hypothetical protein